jgi:RHS repeat-associated protein
MLLKTHNPNPTKITDMKPIIHTYALLLGTSRLNNIFRNSTATINNSQKTQNTTKNQLTKLLLIFAIFFYSSYAWAAGTITLTSGAGTNAQTICINTSITTITYSTTGTNGATFSGLPSGVYGNWSSNVVTISGTPTVSGSFSYTVNLTGGGSASGTIYVRPNATIILNSGSSSQSVCVNTPISQFVYKQTGAPNYTVSGLPPGVTSSFSSGYHTISGTPTSAGTFTYTITTIGATCSNASVSGTITVNPNASISLYSYSKDQTLCINEGLEQIKFTLSNATDATVTGLPSGLSGSLSYGYFNIYGSPTVSGTFNYTVTTTGASCSNASISGTITVNPLATVNAGPAISICKDATSPPLGGQVAGGGWTGRWYNQSGITGTFSNINDLNATWTPPAGFVGTTTLTLRNTTGCGTISSTKTITVNPWVSPSISISASDTSVCPGSSVTFTATPTNGGTSPLFQWKKNGTNVGTNSSNNSYTYYPNNGDVISCVLTSNATCASPGTATSNSINVPVNQPPVGLNYTNASPIYPKGVAITTNNATLTTTGSPAPTYSVSPALPTGLSLNTGTGAITGTPTVNVAPTNYTVSASNCCGNATKVLNITVGQSPAGLNYTNASPIYPKGVAITTNNATLTTTGYPAPTFSVSPALPTGLSLNTGTGAITGTPTVNVAPTNYTVSASNCCGNATKVLNITVGQSPAGLNYTNASPIYVKGVAITTNSATLTTTGSPAPTFSVSPALPTGLSLNTSTGAITGTPTVKVSATNYTVTASNSFGNTTKVLTITVNLSEVTPPSSLSVNGTTLTVQNGSHGSNGYWVWYKDFKGQSPDSTTAPTFTMSDSRPQRVRVRAEYTENSIPGKTYFISQKVPYADTLALPDKNYIVTYTPVSLNGVDETGLGNLPLEEQGVVVQYYDGLGRPTQNVAVNQSFFFNDVVTGVRYDSFGRQDSTYLPATQHGKGTFVDNQPLLIKNFYSGTPNEVNGLPSLQGRLASKTFYESSPLSRIDSITDPAGGTTSYLYGTNAASEVTLWKVETNNCVKAGTYATNELYMTQTTDPDGKITKEYKDKLGQVILKQAGDAVTYYVYDDFGLLRYVLSPKASASMTDSIYTPDSVRVKGLCYYYQYDARKRMVKKQLPGAEEVLMVYDTRDRLILTQDGKTRVENGQKWMYTKYDEINRPIETGWMTTSDPWGTLQTTFANIVGYSNYTNETALTKTHYDNYTGCPLVCNVTGNNTDVKGMVTWTWSALLEGTQNEGIVRATYYDNKYRVIDSEVAKVNSSNTVVPDLINVSTINGYDFVGNLLSSTETYSGQMNQTIYKWFTYDHAGRLEKVEQQLGENSNDRVVLAQNDYNDLGQLVLKKLHSANNQSFVQDIDYQYDIRGWLKSINNFSDESFRKLYAQELEYRRNGNIKRSTWKNTLFDGEVFEPTNLQVYDFSYDALNRLDDAQYSESGLNMAYSEDPGYDLNGNITSILRRGNKAAFGDPINPGVIDNLAYTYSSNSNQISGIKDTGAGAVHTKEFKPYPENLNYTYTYDANGNATKVPHKQITNINYNYLNLPSQITVGGQNIDYLYDAAGNKLKKTFGNVNSYYQGSVLKINDQTIVQTGEGRAVKNGTAWTYEYDLKDHLGNTRVSFSADNARVSILQTKDYYPFGMEMARNYTTLGDPTKYLYNGKELQDEGGLDMYDYGARFYDPTIGRWHSVDPLAESYYDLSPYSYCAGNPVKYIDVKGEFIGTLIGSVVGAAAGAYDSYKKGGDVWAGAAEGAVSGAIAGASVDLAVAATVATGGGALVVIGAGAAAGAIGGAAGAVAGDATGQVVESVNKGSSLSNAVSNISTANMADKAKTGAITGTIGGTVGAGVAKGLQAVTKATNAMQSTMAKSITEVSKALPAADGATINGVQKTIERGIEALGKNTSSSVTKTSVSTGMATESAIQVGQRIKEDKKP